MRYFIYSATQAGERLSEQGILEYYIDPEAEPDEKERYFTEENDTGNSLYRDAIIVGVFKDDATPELGVKIIDPVREYNSLREIAEMLTGRKHPRRHGIARLYKFPTSSPDDC